MNKLTKGLIALAGLITLAGTSTLVIPRRAVAQGTNGPKITIEGPLPLPTLPVGAGVAQHVELGCLARTFGGPFPCSAYFPDGTSTATPFTVPTGQYLVITSIDFTPDLPGAGIDTVQLMWGGHPGRGWAVSNASTSQLLFPSGMPIGPGSQPMAVGNPGNLGTVLLNLHGYLTSN